MVQLRFSFGSALFGLIVSGSALVQLGSIFLWPEFCGSALVQHWFSFGSALVQLFVA